ncbi:MAG TPA: hypothetical protein VIW21_01550 [Chthoniobacterales bacterium]
MLNLTPGDADEQVVSPTAAVGRDLALGHADELTDRWDPCWITTI